MSRQYIYGLGNTPIAQVSGTSTYYNLTDGLGSVMATTDSSGNVVNSYTYDAYGATTSSTGSQPNPFQFAGQQTDPTGLQYLRARYYDPVTGTFLSSDPLGVSPAWPGNPYAYVNGNPVLNSHPLGLFCIGPVCADRNGVSVGGHEAVNGLKTVGSAIVNTGRTTGRIAWGCANDVVMCDVFLEHVLGGVVLAAAGPVTFSAGCVLPSVALPLLAISCAIAAPAAVGAVITGAFIAIQGIPEFNRLSEKQQ